LVGAGWTAFTYFDQRKRKSPEGEQGVPPEQVASILRALVLQSQQPSQMPEPPTASAADLPRHPIDRRTLGKFLSLVLRHDPAKAALNIDDEGWADVDALIAGLNAASYSVTREDLDEVVRTSLGKRDEPRFGFSPDGQRIRANWGRSFGRPS